MSGPQIVLKKGVVKQVSQNLLIQKHFLCHKKKEKPCHATAYNSVCQNRIEIFYWTWSDFVKGANLALEI